MKRIIILCFCIAVSSALFGCRIQDRSIRSSSIKYAREHQSQLVECAEELTEKLSDIDDPMAESRGFRYYEIRLIDDALYMQQGSSDESQSFKSYRTLKLLRESKYGSISYHADPDGSHAAVVFSCYGTGIGSGTKYYDIQYVPTASVEDLWWYQNMEYTPQGEGYYGSSGDNSFYYQILAENLFYTEASF